MVLRNAGELVLRDAEFETSEAVRASAPSQAADEAGGATLAPGSWCGRGGEVTTPGICETFGTGSKRQHELASRVGTEWGTGTATHAPHFGVARDVGFAIGQTIPPAILRGTAPARRAGTRRALKHRWILRRDLVFIIH